MKEGEKNMCKAESEHIPGDVVVSKGTPVFCGGGQGTRNAEFDIMIPVSSSRPFDSSNATAIELRPQGGYLSLQNKC